MKATYTKNDYQNIILKIKRFLWKNAWSKLSESYFQKNQGYCRKRI